MPRVSLPRLLAVLLALLVPALAPIAARAEPSDIAAAARGVVRVVLVSDDGGGYGLVGHGSGFAVGPDLVVTNAHVVDEARGDPRVRIGVVPSEGKGGWFARIVGLAPEKDLALLKLTERGRLPVATLFSGAVSDGEDVFAIGYPGNVDLAQGLAAGDIVSPTSPVKTRGSVSSGRSSKAFETILHTAPLGAGNSGGPLVDGCGRVLGANSFGTVASGGDSEFYFAVSAREILRFLLALGVQPRTAGNACLGFAELDRAEAERAAGAQARSDEAARAEAARLGAAQEQAHNQALFEVAAERENLLGGAGVALLLAAGLGAAAWALAGRERRGQAVAAGIGAGLFVAGAVVAMVLRPGFDQVDPRARRLETASAARAPSNAPAGGKPLAGKLACTLEPERSRVTVSDMADVALDWGAGGCAEGGKQYGLGNGGWSRVAVPGDEETATVARFDPANGEYRVERYYLDLDTMARLREERAAIKTPACGADAGAARRLGEDQAALTALLPAEPNERLVYRCAAARAG